MLLLVDGKNDINILSNNRKKNWIKNVYLHFSLLQGNWMDSFGKFATREEIMMVLVDVEKFFIRASYAPSMSRSV